MIVFAVNIHTGGGKVLLDELIASHPFGAITHLFADARYVNPGLPSGVVVKNYPPTLTSRFKAQVDLKNLVSGRVDLQQMPVLFFGNQPPIFKINAPVIVYVQNCFLLSGVPLPTDGLKAKLRNFVERISLKAFRQNYSEIWVQSNWMVELTKLNFPEKKVLRKPFLPKMPIPSSVQRKIYDFINVTSLSKHKNYDVFLNALSILDTKLNKKIRILTILDNSVDKSFPEVPTFKNIQLETKNKVLREELFSLYQKSHTAVVTSSYESFCLPLYEALHFKLNVICLRAAYAQEVQDRITLYNENEPLALAEQLRLSCLDIK